MCEDGAMRIGVLLTMGFLEAEAAPVLDAVRILREAGAGIEAFTLAKSRHALEGAAGTVWTAKYALSARPELDVLVVPGSKGLARAARDLQIELWLEEVWPRLEAVFLGANGPVFLGELGRAPQLVAAHPAYADEVKRYAKLGHETAYAVGKVTTTAGYLFLLGALLDHLQSAEFDIEPVLEQMALAFD
ncbi:thiamine biosynthesis protein ThiJ [Oceanithermus sp.]|nr:thiamine biosynthesis protein ThiJ [Oceanithermus sp.]